MPVPSRISDEQLQEALAKTGGGVRATARLLGIDHSTLIPRIARLRAAMVMPDIEIQAPPEPEIPVDDLIAQRIAAFRQKQAHEDARSLIPVTVKDDRPIGILHFGDPHVDDDGTDLELLFDHAKLVRTTPGLYGATPGDTTNNWTGRLARLWGEQSTKGIDAWRIGERFIEEVEKWLYLVGGNHDLWSGAGDPLQWITRQNGALYQASEVRIALNFPNGRTVRINCRHDFKGSSQYNPAHGPMKALFFGVRDHLAIAGHKHESAYGVLKDPQSGTTMHAVKVASYKVFDRYARESQFRDQHLGPACLTTIDPSLPDDHPDLLKVWWDPHEGASFLTWKRSRRSAA